MICRQAYVRALLLPIDCRADQEAQIIQEEDQVLVHASPCELGLSEDGSVLVGVHSSNCDA